MDIFTVLFYQPIYNVIVYFYHVLGDNLGLSIIAIGIVSRLVLLPISLRQMRLSETSKELSEKLNKIKKKYKNNKEKQQGEMLKVQKEYLPAQIGGCLPLIFQLIFFLNVYHVIADVVQYGGKGFSQVAYSFVEGFSSQVSGSFVLNLDLTIAPSAVGVGVQIIPYIILVALVGLTQYVSFKIVFAFRNKAKKMEDQAEEKNKKAEKKGNDDKQPSPDDFQEIMQKTTNQVMLVFPFLLALISYGLPAGLSLYLITTSTFVIIQQSIYFRIKSKKQLNHNINNT
jgi:YidC/Oxa1 family membrane protein insertase